MLSAAQRSYLAGLASTKTAILQLGKAGASDAFITQLDTLLTRHELVKLRFVDFKGEKRELSASLAESTGSDLVRVLGNTAIFYKRQSDPEKRQIVLPGD